MIIFKMYTYLENIIHNDEKYIWFLAIAYSYILSYPSQDIWMNSPQRTAVFRNINHDVWYTLLHSYISEAVKMRKTFSQESCQISKDMLLSA